MPALYPLLMMIKLRFVTINSWKLSPSLCNIVFPNLPHQHSIQLSFCPPSELGSPYASNPNPIAYSTWVSDIWGWVDPQNGQEYALVGMWDGVSIVDISNPRHPKPLVFVETTGGVVNGLESFYNIWRDVKVRDSVLLTLLVVVAA